MSPFTVEPTSSVAALGEARLIDQIKSWLGDATPAAPYGMGDDCAVLPLTTLGAEALVTADPIIYGKHFDDALSPQQAAAKLLRRNLSDIASMGGRPLHAVVSLALCPESSLIWVERFHRALADEAQRFEVNIVGGDVSSAPRFLGAFLTLYGEMLPGSAPLLRKKAVAGSPVFVSGDLGGTRIQKHHNFTPRLSEGQWLAQSGLCSSCTDLSDGLGKDYLNLTPDGLCSELDCELIPLSEDAHTTAKASGRSPLYHAFNDGEDFELLFTLHPQVEVEAFTKSWASLFETKLTRIGTLVEGDESLRLKNAPANLIVSGYEHLG